MSRGMRSVLYIRLRLLDLPGAVELALAEQAKK